MFTIGPVVMRISVRERSHIMSAAEGGGGGKPLLTYHCSNTTKTIDIADMGGGGSKVGKSC